MVCAHSIYCHLKVCLDILEAILHTMFAKLLHLGMLAEGLKALEEASKLKYDKKLLWGLMPQLRPTLQYCKPISGVAKMTGWLYMSQEVRENNA